MGDNSISLHRSYSGTKKSSLNNRICSRYIAEPYIIRSNIAPIHRLRRTNV